MDGEWLTYRQVAVRLGVSVEAARRRALRGKWSRMPGNDGMTRVRPPDDLSDRCAPDVRSDARPDNSALVHALESHIKTLQGENEALMQQLTAAEARAAQEAEKTARAIAAFSSLAERLDALAADRSASSRARPWWRRLAG